MVFADVLLCLDSRFPTATALGRAVEHAATWRARLTVLDLRDRDAGSSGGTASFEFDMDLRSALRLGGVEGRLTSEIGGLAGLARLQATDLILVPSDEEALPSCPDFIAAALETSGVPVLAERMGGDRSPVGRRILLPWAWDRASRRAVRDAMPMLADAEEVTLVPFGRDDADAAAELFDVSGHLARHGVKVRVETGDPLDATDGAAIGARARRLGADLVVLGLGGPPRWFGSTIPPHAAALMREGPPALFLSP